MTMMERPKMTPLRTPARFVLPPPMRKPTVMGIMGKTQGVMTPASPARKAMSRKLQKPWPEEAAASSSAGLTDASPGVAVGSTSTDTSVSLRMHSAPLQVWYSRYPLTVKGSCEAGTITCLKRTVPSKYLTSMPKPSSSLTWASATSSRLPKRVNAVLSSGVNVVAMGPPLTGTVLYTYQSGARFIVKTSSTFP